ncbi:MAG: DedA family protein [Candidatus Levybacteria bacterium]|nr:DedA family protein [Candidatus Levybacteria bacterium]
MQLETILPAIGYLGILAIIFAESGLLFGFFLPGDSLLFTAGFLASQGIFNIVVLCFICFLGAVLGDSVGYAFGHKVGKKLFRKKDSFFFHPDHIIKAEKFYEKYGKKTIILARFMPAVRTFAPIVAGIGSMNYKTFLAYNIIGGILWAICLPLLGFFMGSMIPDVDKYLLPIVGFIIMVSVLPQAITILKNKETRKHILVFITKPFNK